MKILAKVFAVLFAMAAVSVGAYTARLAIVNRDAAPVLVSQPAAAVERAKDMMDAVSRGDFPIVGQYLYGTPNLGTLTDEAGETEQMIWSAFVDSISYEFPGECYASDSGIALDVNIRSLDISGVTANLRERSQTLLNERVAAAENVKDIYDKNNNYREDFVMQVLKDAVTDALAEDVSYTEQSLTLHLVYEQEQWWIVPEQDFLGAISGGLK